MSCGRADRIDFEAFLLASDASELDAFRAHYPGCEECAATVARWTALDLALRDVLVEELGVELDPDASHPDLERLERYGLARESMGPDAAIVERHLASCPTCRSELALMSRFDPAALASGLGRSGEEARQAAMESAPTPARVYDREGAFLRGVRGFFESLADALMAPGFVRVAVPALGIIAVVAATLLWRGAPDGRSDESGTAPGLVVQQPAIPEPPPEATPPRAEPSLPGPARDEATEQLAQVAPDVRPEPAPEKAPSSPESRGPSPSLAPVAPRISPRVAETQEEILLASLDAAPLPAYRRPTGLGATDWMDEFGPVRSGLATAPVRALAPADHVGLSLRAGPRLWWSLPETTPHAIEITIVDERAIEPVLERVRPGPHAAGLHSIDLAEAGVRLESGVDYRWFVTLLVDPDRPTRNPVAMGALRVAAADDSRRAAVDAAPRAQRGHVLAAEGVWYDAYDFFAELARAHPEDPALAAHRDRLDRDAQAADAAGPAEAPR